MITAIILDVLVVGIFSLAIYIGYRRGFLKTAFDLCSWIIAALLTEILYPYTAKFLTFVGMDGVASDLVAKFVKLPDLTKLSPAKAIQSLKIPDVLKTQLLQNNNKVVYKILDVSSFEEYINSYISHILLNGLAILFTFLLVFLIIKSVVFALDLIDKLPIIHFMNRVLGVAVGTAEGLLFTWIFCMVLTWIGFLGKQDLLAGISTSMLTNFFYNHNLLLDSILRIFAV